MSENKNAEPENGIATELSETESSDTTAERCRDTEKKGAQKRSAIDIKRMVGIAMFAALAYGVTFVFRIPVSFLTFDAKDAVITVASFIYGPIAAVLMSLIAALIEFVSISSTGVYGFIMNFASSAVFSSVAALVYKYKKTFAGALISLGAAAVANVSVMLLLNVLVTPHYMAGGNLAPVLDLLPKLILPFNAAKSVMNAAIALFLYKPVSSAMRRIGMVEGKVNFGAGKQTVLTVIICAVAIAASVALFLLTRAINS